MNCTLLFQQMAPALVSLDTLAIWSNQLFELMSGKDVGGYFHGQPSGIYEAEEFVGRIRVLAAHLVHALEFNFRVRA